MSMQTWFNAMELGRQHRQQDEAIQRRNAFASLAQKAYAAPPDQQAGIVGKAVGIDPAQGFALQENMQAGEDRQRQQLVNMARLLTSSPPEARSGIYQRIRPGLAQLGINAPATYEENPQLIDQTAEGLISSNFAAAGNLRVQSTKVGEDGQIYNVMSNGAIMPTGVFAENRRQWVETTDEQGRPLAGAFDPRAGVLGGQSQAGAQPTQSLSVPSLIAANFPGARITSGIRGPELNQSVGGVPNSMHMTGDAVDVVPRNAEESAQIRQFAQKNGLQVIPYPDGRLHLERGGSPRQNFSPVPAPGQQSVTAPGGLIRGRLPEEQAAAISEAQRRAQLEAEASLAPQLAEAERLKREASLQAERNVQPLPTDALKLALESEDKINGAASLQNRLNSWQEKIRTGRLQLGPGINLRWEAELAAGNPSPQAIEYGNFKADLESIRNDVLRLNAGVQTEGDAQRAMNELVSNFGSGAYVMERLKTLANSNSRAVQFHRQQAERIRSNYGQQVGGEVSDDELINRYRRPNGAQ